MNILRFPKTIKLELPDRLRQALDVILELRTDIRSDEELLLRVIAEGVVTLLNHEKDRVERHATVQSVAERMEQRLKDMARDVEGYSELSVVSIIDGVPSTLFDGRWAQVGQAQGSEIQKGRSRSPESGRRRASSRAAA